MGADHLHLFAGRERAWGKSHVPGAAKKSRRRQRKFLGFGLLRRRPVGPRASSSNPPASHLGDRSEEQRRVGEPRIDSQRLIERFARVG
jgi:hypothetical protein